MSEPTNFYFYDVAGRITATGRGEADIQQPPGGETVVAYADEIPPNHYHANGSLVPQPPCPITAALVGRVLTLSGVPLWVNVRVSLDATATIMQDSPDGGMVITLPAAGFYQIDADPFPARAFSQRFEVA